MIGAVTQPPLPRLLEGFGELPMGELESHLRVHGPLPDLLGIAPARIIELADEAGLCGRGGASFPAAKKLRAVAARRKPTVLVANGSEGEPASKKDRVLLRELPHLVLDGAALAARAVGADDAIIALSKRDTRAGESLKRAVGERRAARLRDPQFKLVGTPEHWLVGQETALVNVLNGGPVKPTFGSRPLERGVAQCPTLVQNVETLAHLALITRHGPRWFRQLGGERAPGSTLVTLSGALAAPGVYEIDPKMPLQELLESAGVWGGLRAVLVGGYFGTWLPARALPGLRLDGEHLAERGRNLGAGVIVALDETRCPVAETARIADYFASQTSGQCGPCVNGLEAIAHTIQTLAAGTAQGTARADLARWFAEVPGRGACQHPTGAVRFLVSALQVFHEEFDDHDRHGRCDRCSRAPVLPCPLVDASVTR